MVFNATTSLHNSNLIKKKKNVNNNNSKNNNNNFQKKKLQTHNKIKNKVPVYQYFFLSCHVLCVPDEGCSTETHCAQ